MARWDGGFTEGMSFVCFQQVASQKIFVTYTIRCLLGASSPSSPSPSLSLLILHTHADTTSAIEYRLAMPTNQEICKAVKYI